WLVLRNKLARRVVGKKFGVKDTSPWTKSVQKNHESHVWVAFYRCYNSVEKLIQYEAYKHYLFIIRKYCSRTKRKK
ncbi:unnamed protein product, partial [Heterotrigona itama]